MAVLRKRKYQCDDCETQFVKFQEDGDYSIPDCPTCHPDQTPFKGFPAVRDSTKMASKALDLAQRVAENEFGMTNMRDGQRAGEDNATLSAPPPTASDTQAAMQTFTEQMAAQAATAQNMGEWAQRAAANLRMGGTGAAWQPAGGNITAGRSAPPDSAMPIVETQHIAKDLLARPNVISRSNG